MKLKDVENEAMKIIVACNKIREKYSADGVKVYLKDEEHATIKVISEDHVVRVIRVGGETTFETPLTKEQRNARCK